MKNFNEFRTEINETVTANMIITVTQINLAYNQVIGQKYFKDDSYDDLMAKLFKKIDLLADQNYLNGMMLIKRH
jgi:hypothetical protein